MLNLVLVWVLGAETVCSVRSFAFPVSSPAGNYQTVPKISLPINDKQHPNNNFLNIFQTIFFSILFNNHIKTKNNFPNWER